MKKNLNTYQFLKVIISSYPFADAPKFPYPDPPVCFVSKKPESQCWAVCQCPCEVVEALEAQQNLTVEELEHEQENKTKEIESQLKVKLVFHFSFLEWVPG